MFLFDFNIGDVVYDKDWSDGSHYYIVIGKVIKENRRYITIKDKNSGCEYKYGDKIKLWDSFGYIKFDEEI